MTVRVVFVSGYVRSGSTLLDIMLGSIPGYFSVGETTAMLHGPGFSKQDLCTCEAVFEYCEFWDEVWKTAHPIRTWSARPDYIYGFRGNATTSRLPSLVFQCKRRRVSKTLEKYSGLLGGFYGAIARVAGCDVIVDSSKTPSHGLVLSTIPEIELHVVHLVRDARAVVYSQRRTKAKPDVSGAHRTLPRRNFVMSSLRWLKANITAELLKGCSKSYARIRYEDLVANPNRVVGQILSATGQPPHRDDIDFMNISTSHRHNVAGNPMRLAGRTISVRVDNEWERELGRVPRSLTTCISLPVLRRYGYSGW